MASGHFLKSSSSTTEQRQTTDNEISDSRLTVKSDKDLGNSLSSIATCSRTSRNTLLCDGSVIIQPSSCVSTSSVLRQQKDISPDSPLDGEKPNDLLQRLYELWRIQLTPSYRPHVYGNPEATAEHNLECVKSIQRSRLQKKGKQMPSAMVLQAVVYMKKVQISRPLIFATALG